MIKFNIDNLTCDYVLTKRVTTALGGSITYIDDDVEQVKGQEVTIREDMPFAVARQFMKRNAGKSNFIVPVVCCIVRYEGMIVHVEKQSVFNVSTKWSATCEYAIESMIAKQVRDGGNWFTDGVSIFCLPENSANHEAHESLTTCGRFRGMSVSAYKFSNLSDLKLVETSTTLSLVSFKPSNSTQAVLSPPIWTNVFTTTRKGEDTNAELSRFDIMNDQYFVNLNFVLAAGTKIGSTFGWDEIGPLALDQLMINLNTVNLPNVPNSIRTTYDTNQGFMMMMAWLLGFQKRCTNLAEYAVVRALMKYLTTKGIYNRSKLSKALTTEAPELVSSQDAHLNVSTKYQPHQIHAYFSGGVRTMMGSEAVDSATRSILMGDVI